MTIFQKFLVFLGFEKKIIKHIELSPESVKEHNLIKALANENAELKGERAKFLSQLGQLRESKKDEEEEEEVRWELNKQKKELEKKVYPKYFSLKSFYWKLFHKKPFKDKLGFFSFDRSKKLAKFGDFGFSSDGDIVLLDNENRVIIKQKNLNDIFQSVGGLGNDAEVFKIPLNLDKDYGYVENPMVWEAPELVPTIDGKFKYAKARKKPFYDYLKELNAKISAQQQYIEEIEMTNTKLQEENDELKIAGRITEDSAETSRAELSGNEKEISAIQRAFRGTERDLAQVRYSNIILEKELDEIEEALEKLKEKAKEEGITLKFDDVIERISSTKKLFREKTIMPMTLQAPEEISKGEK